MILLAIQSVLFASSLLLWLYRFTVVRNRGSLLSKREPQSVSPLGVLDIGVTVFIWFTLQAAGLYLVMMLMGLTLSQIKKPEDLSPEQMLEFTGYMMLLQLAATWLAMIWFVVRHQRVEWLGTRFREDALVGLAGALMLIPPVMLIQFFVIKLVPYEHPTLDSLIENFSFRSACWAWVAAVGVAPLAEEFFFRGVIQGWLQRSFSYDEPKEVRFIGGHIDPATSTAIHAVTTGQKLIQDWAPIFITSIIFAGVHIGQGPAPIPLFFLSLGLGYLYRQTGSFVPCVVVHLILNAMSMTMLTLSLIYPELAPAKPDPTAAFFFSP